MFHSGSSLYVKISLHSVKNWRKLSIPIVKSIIIGHHQDFRTLHLQSIHLSRFPETFTCLSIPFTKKSKNSSHGADIPGWVWSSQPSLADFPHSFQFTLMSLIPRELNQTYSFCKASCYSGFPSGPKSHLVSIQSRIPWHPASPTPYASPAFHQEVHSFIQVELSLWPHSYQSPFHHHCISLDTSPAKDPGSWGRFIRSSNSLLCLSYSQPLALPKGWSLWALFGQKGWWFFCQNKGKAISLK